MSLAYPERKWTKERIDHTGKPNLNRAKGIPTLARSITNRKPDSGRLDEKAIPAMPDPQHGPGTLEYEKT
jgi:hypothetical protein